MKRIERKIKIRKEVDEVRFLQTCIEKEDYEARFLFSYFSLEKIWSLQHDGGNLSDPTETRLKKIDVGNREVYLEIRRDELDREMRKDLREILNRRKEYNNRVKKNMGAAMEIEMQN